MGTYKVNKKDLFFILKEQIQYGQLCNLHRYSDLDEKTLDLAINEALNFAKKEVDPLNEIGEERGVRQENGKVLCPEEFKSAYQKYGGNGWIALARDTEYGGQGFPHMMRIVVNDIMYGACQAFNMAPSLTHGAAHLIESFGTQELKETYVAKMYNGEWTGTMALTEPEAGSDLGAIETIAYPLGEQAYKIKGTKTFISWGEHDLTDNIVHLLLARIEGAPEGTRGISLFVVPKYRVDEQGNASESNDVLCQRIEEKLGLHASPTATLNFGDKNGCIGYLCGEENRGLAHMFQMMNQARINTGVSGMAIGSTAYLNALEYTKNRVQGKDIARSTSNKVPIIQHPDIRRNLMWMKASVDGMRSMIYSAAYWSDMSLELEECEQKDHYSNLIDFMTPIIKAYCSDQGFRVTEVAMQCLGGYGYCKDYPIEQYMRDSKIMSLYEGTNGIQSIDLMGRKMRINDAAPYKAFQKEMNDFVENNSDNEYFAPEISELKDSMEKMWTFSSHMFERMQQDPLDWASKTYPSLKAFGELIMVWRLLEMGIIAQRQLEKKQSSKFYLGKLYQAKYYASEALPKIKSILASCSRDHSSIVQIDDASF